MGYVNESYVAPSLSHSTKYVRDDGYTVSRVVGPYSRLQKSQFGYRSGPLGPQEQQWVEFLDSKGTWGRQSEMLNALDRIQQATTPTPSSRTASFDVHHRTYNEFKCNGWSGMSAFGRPNPYVSFVTSGAAHMETTSFTPPAKPSTTELQGMAGAAMRNYIPTRPDAQIARFIGELRDTNKMLAVSNYLPGQIGHLGGAYLNVQFGVMPSASDIHKMSESILHADKLTRQFVRDSARLIRRSSTRRLETQTQTGSVYLVGSNANYSCAGVNFFADPGMPGSTYIGPEAKCYLGYTRDLRTFSTFEYFVGDPTGFTERMDSYVGKAQKLLGVNLDLATIYALTPWTWMLDWFVDIGGLLNYQQSVSDNHLVQRRGGYVLEDSISMEVVISGDRSSGDKVYKTLSPTSLTGRKVYQNRAPGSPYGMSPTWSLNNFQWSVLGALGLTKASKVGLFSS